MYQIEGLNWREDDYLGLWETSFDVWTEIDLEEGAHSVKVQDKRSQLEGTGSTKASP